MSDRETLEHLLEVDATFDDESTAKPLNPNEAAAIRAVLADNERLRGALKGQPVIKSEWEEKCAEVERLRVGVETLHNTVAVQKRELDGLEAKNERLRAIKRSDTEMIEECRKELAELANNRDGLEHDWSERGASIDAALEHCAQASVLLGQSGGDAEAATYVGLALEALKGKA